MVEVSLRRVLGRHKLEQIEKLDNHFVLCGYGRIGRTIALEITAEKLPLVVIENLPEVQEQCTKDGILFVPGDASDEDNLTAAGIRRARGLISVVSSDAENVFIVLTARGLNPDLYIVSRASEEKSIKKLKSAGADQVISPYVIGARRMAQVVLRPAVADFIETTMQVGSDIDLAMEEILVTPQSQLKDITLLESNIRRDLDLIVIAIKTAEGEMQFNPSAQAQIRVGDTLIAVGRRSNMQRLVKLLGAASVGPTWSNPRKNRVIS
jgi:voltage-gated potassium channel